MRIGMALDYRGGFTDTVEELRDLESAGLDMVFVAEGYSFDAVSQLGYIAAKTDRLEIATGILQFYSRTPTLTAMTAAGLDHVSGGRFTLGLGASGPQVVEGFHGVPYHAPLARTREIVEICRSVWRREAVVHSGKHYQVPLPPGEGTGLGKPLKLVQHPVRDRIPILLAAIGPKNVALAAEVAEGWAPVFFYPEKANTVWGEALTDGKAKRPPELGELDICVSAVTVSIGDGEHSAALHAARSRLALYIGGMGAREKNFYNDLACRYGFEAEARKIQDLYLAGSKDEAVAAVPEELVRGTTLIGSADEVKARVAAYRNAGVTTLSVGFGGATASRSRLDQIEQLAEFCH
ncbi:LLM class F420-dependent oxidoreductase [Streptomyces sp. NPDC048415]|uniref:LLM class F420-dependent oxidoreductase n=1 Tax=Streptomyces sp. NPDC048415 TaxID=3154822 RepID=UPI00342CBD32